MLIERIACGGTAEVWRAREGVLGPFTRQVAIKRLLPSWCDNVELREMLVDEARVLTHLKHRAIAQVLEEGSENGVPFIAMEFVDGIDCARLLHRLIREGSQLPAELAIYIVGQVLLALDFAHRSADSSGRPLGIVHRDISPSNILLSWNGEVKVTDFGIAKGFHRTRSTEVGQLRGKYSYMAPEQAAGETLDAKADLFSCGIVLFELLTASRLFDAKGDCEILERVRCADVPKDSMRALAPELQMVLMPALSREKRFRHRSARDMYDDLQSAARTMGALAGSAELSQYLHLHFDENIKGDAANAALSDVHCGQSTRVDSRLRKTRRRRFIPAARISVFAMFCIFFLAPERTHVSALQDAYRADPPRPQIELPEQSGPPQTKGSIAIDSIPPGAEGTLAIDGVSNRIRTPFAMGEIDLKDGLSGNIELGMDGYRKAMEKFRIDSGSPVLAKIFHLEKEIPSRLYVQAEPWGIVDIPGFASRRETPVSGLGLRAGEYRVHVSHPPSGKSLAQRVKIAEGQTMRCRAKFSGRPTMACQLLPKNLR